MVRLAPRHLQMLVVALVATGSLGASFLLKQPCLENDWADGFHLRTYCYSDIQYLYTARHLDLDRMPYTEEFNEYPILTGFFAYHLAQATPSMESYVLLTFAILLAAGALTTWGLWRLGLPWTRCLAWAAAPSLVIHATTNWDLLAVALATWGWVEWRRGRAFESAILFGLGGATKLYPAFFLPFVFLAALRAGDRRGAKRVVAGGLGGLVVPNLFVWLRNPDLWLETWRFQADRQPDFESIWHVLMRPFLEGQSPGFVAGPGWDDFVTWSVLVVLAVTGSSLAWRQWHRRIDPLTAGGILTTVFLLVNTVYSPQYTLWILPILLALGVRWTPYWAFVAADLGVFLVRYPLFLDPAGMAESDWVLWSRYLVVARWVCLAWALRGILRSAQHAPATVQGPLPSPGPEPPAEPRPVVEVAP